jgi:2-dehydropantoate 2-reductase
MLDDNPVSNYGISDTEDMMRIAIVGVGGVGGFFGGRLAQAGEDVFFVARGAHLQALQTQGLRVDGPPGDFVIQPVQVTNDPAKIGVVDAVILAVKAWQVSEAAEAIRPLIGPETCVIPLQNGVEAPAQIAAVLGPGHAVGGLCGLVTFLVAPGHVKNSSARPFVKFGELDHRLSSRLENLRQAFVRAGLNVEIPPDIQTALWMKYLLITPWSGLGALTRSPIGIWRSVPESRRLSQQMLEEVLAIAQARRIALPADALQRATAQLDGVAADSLASMQRDIMAGRPSELDAQIGAVVRMGQAVEVVTPAHAFVLASLLPQELRARGQLQFQG